MKINIKTIELVKSHEVFCLSMNAYVASETGEKINKVVSKLCQVSFLRSSGTSGKKYNKKQSNVHNCLVSYFSMLEW